MHRAPPRIHRPPTLTTQVQAALRDDIATGIIAPGERVVVDHIAERLGVSATPVREAIAGCVRDGLIVKAPGGRLQVVPLTQDYVHQVFLVRGALEGLASELAAPRITDADIAALRAALEETGIALTRGDYRPYVATDAQLHGTVCAAAANPILTHELDTLQAHVEVIRRYSQRQAGEHMQCSHSEHVQIVEALATRNPVNARQAMEAHIRCSGDRIARLIEFRDHPQSSPRMKGGADEREGGSHGPG